MPTRKSAMTLQRFISDSEPDPDRHEAGERRPEGEAGQVRGRLTPLSRKKGVTNNGHLVTTVRVAWSLVTPATCSSTFNAGCDGKACWGKTYHCGVLWSSLPHHLVTQ